MKIQSLSLIASALFVFTACPGDDSGTSDTTGQMPTTTDTPTTDGSATDTGTATTPTTTSPEDSTGGDTSSCEPAMKTCMQACEQLYDCGVEDGNCMFTGDDEEKKTFVDNCVINPLCDASAAAVNECDCAGTITVIKGLYPEFTDSCDNGISGGSGTDSGGSDTGGGSGSTGG